MPCRLPGMKAPDSKKVGAVPFEPKLLVEHQRKESLMYTTSEARSEGFESSGARDRTSDC